MLKKLLIASAVLAVSSSVAFAAAPYLGVGLGVNDAQSKLSNNDNGATVRNFGARSALLNVFGGYGGLVTSNVYLAGELLFNATSTQAKVTDDDGDTSSFTAKNTWGISFIPGFMLSDRTMVYGRLGVVKTGFNAKATGGGTSVSKNRTLTGGQLGLGMQANIAQNVDLRGEYVYTSYRSFKVGDGSAKFNPSTDQFNLAILYKFD